MGNYIIRYINADGTSNFRATAFTRDNALKLLLSKLERLATLPAGCKLEIAWEPDDEGETEHE